MALAVVTGASRGIGAVVVRHLAQRGAEVLAVARRADELRQSAAAGSGRITSVVADLATDAGVAAVRAAVGDRSLTALIHSAGKDHAERASSLCSDSR